MARSNACCSLALLLLCGALLLEMNPGTMVMSATDCPLICVEVEYMTCPSTGDKHLIAPCNCCNAPKGCILHLPDGTSISCS
ncbi:hypothetical protein BT93_F2382 [Corymbia citriodora subsp. variegata]|nr:hypothetical protein BT93_F2382 [Corymbia citriodora subsp. variegata]